VDDGLPAGEGYGFEVSSSASMPAVVAPGMRVLEIGTGTGYNAALLAHRLGAEQVVSVEVDPAVAEHARRALDYAGFGAVTVATGPGGLVITPWGTPFYSGGLLALTVAGAGTATGRLVGPASFMWLHAQRIPRYTVGRIMRATDPATVSTTDLHPWYVAGDANAATAIGLRVPRCENFYLSDDGNVGTLYLLDQWTCSWATVDVTQELPYQVRQAGQRKLWEEVQAAYRWWSDASKPAVDAWQFTVSSVGQRIELAARAE
jgi:SAM-dependent methyltransferase